MGRDIAVAILCGGRSSRMGRDKGLMAFLGRPLIQRVVERIRPLSDDILLVTRRCDDYRFLGLPMLSDLVPDRGPLGGVFTAMARHPATVMAVVACDMPFVNAALLEHARSQLEARGCDAVVPLVEDRPEALHAVYRVAPCLQAARAALAAGELKMMAWLDRVHAHFLSADEVAGLDPDGLAFMNVNTVEEFRAAEALAGARA